MVDLTAKLTAYWPYERVQPRSHADFLEVLTCTNALDGIRLRTAAYGASREADLGVSAGNGKGEIFVEQGFDLERASFAERASRARRVVMPCAAQGMTMGDVQSAAMICKMPMMMR